MRRLALVVALVLALAAPAAAVGAPLAVGSPALWQAFVCTHRHEGSWTAAIANGYYGRPQMDSTFEKTHESEFVSMWGHADSWPPAVQTTVAMRAYTSRGFSPWSNTSRACGLL